MSFLILLAALASPCLGAMRPAGECPAVHGFLTAGQIPARAFASRALVHPPDESLFMVRIAQDQFGHQT